MSRLPALVILVFAVVGIIYGRVTRRTPIAILGFVLLAAGFVVGVIERG